MIWPLGIERLINSVSASFEAQTELTKMQKARLQEEAWVRTFEIALSHNNSYEYCVEVASKIHRFTPKGIEK